MAKMIPSRLSEDTKSAAERKLFHRFEQMPETDDWCVIHSVGLAKHSTQSQGECDFVVIAPGLGTFVLEVKGGMISHQNGAWLSTDRYGVCYKIKNPQVEANEGMHSLINFIKEHDTEKLQQTLFGFGVVFPDVTVHGQFSFPDLDDLQIADIDDAANMREYIVRLSKFWKSRSTNPYIHVPNKQQAAAMIELLRPEHEFRVSIASEIRTVERQTITLTENQQDVFEGLLDNERCLISGSAGTGKTVLATECARYWLQQKKKVGFFCYNKMLGAWLRENTVEDEGLVCNGLLEYMEEIAQVKMSEELRRNKAEDPNRFYKKQLPDLFDEVIIENEFDGFDCIILDEAQDLFEPRYLESLNLMLKGGLADGSWYFFMDAERQNLYHSSKTYEAANLLLKEYKTYYTKYTLRDNCRNSAAIIEKLDALFGTHTRFKRMENRGTDVVIKSYKRSNDQLEYLQDMIQQLMNSGVLLDDIVILSPMRYDRSVVGTMEQFPVSTDRKSRKGKLFFSTVQSCKGLESSVIILTDFDSIDYDQKKNLLYVGMTRARSALYILVSDKARKTMNEMIQGVKNNAQTEQKSNHHS